MSDAALDATADALARRALSGLPEEPRRADLARLAPPLARLLSARLDAELGHAAPASAWIDADATAQARQAWREAAEPTLHVPRDQREGIVRQATERALTHLLRPADTLAAVAFENEPGPLPVGTALARIRAFGPYPYLAQITERYVERKDLSHIDRAGLERLLRRIDRRMVSAFGVDDWMTLLEPLFAWVGPLGRPPGAVPTGLLRTLFQSKGATALHDALDEIDTIDAETLRGLVAQAFGVAATPPASAPPPDPAPAPEPDPAPEPEDPENEAESVPDTTIWSTTPPLAPPAERQPSPWESDEPTPADTLDAKEVTAEDAIPDEETRPPVIGSRYATPEFEPDESSVLGPPRPLDPVEATRDAVVEPDDADVVAEADDLDEVAESVLAPPVLDTEPAEDTSSPPTPLDDEPLWQRMARERGAEPVPAAAPPDDDQPLWKRFAQSDLAERLPEADAPSAPVTLADSFAAPHASNPPASVEPSAESAAASDEPRRPLDDLEARVLGADARERRDWYVAELFGGSPSEYHRTLAALDAAPSYTDATAIISSEILRKRSVSPYTDCAVAFIDAVQAQSERR